MLFGGIMSLNAEGLIAAAPPKRKVERMKLGKKQVEAMARLEERDDR
ncbi:MAG: hypothetical protein ACRDGS_00275 [Chloroflexota bacterium]